MQSQSIDFTKDFALEDILSGETVSNELPNYSNSDGGQHDIVLILKKSLYGQVEAARRWYEKQKNGLLKHGFVITKVDPCLFMSKTVMCVVYVDDFIYWERSQSDIDNIINSFK